MKKIAINITGLLFTVFALVALTQAQQITAISGRCPSPNQRVYQSIQATIAAGGNLIHTPCPLGASIFTGNVDFTAATVTGVVSGSGTSTFVPQWTGASSLGNTPLSWSGSSYTFNNTALNATFITTIRPSSTTGLFSVGTGALGMSITQSTNTIANFLTPASGIWTVSDLTNFSNTINANADTWSLVNTTSDNRISFNSIAAGGLTLGDCTTTINDCISQQYFTGATTVTASAAIILQDPSGTTSTTLNTSGGLYDVIARQGVTVDSGGTTFRAGDATAVGNTTLFSVIDSSKTFTFGVGNNTGIFNLAGILNYQLQRTITPAGTTGAQVIDKPAFSVNFAGAAATLVVTNSVVDANSGVLCQVMTADATMFYVQAVAGAGSVTLTARPAAPTAETKVYCEVHN